MKCPDCGTSLSVVSLGEHDQVYRCFKCGGFWLDSWAANRITSQVLKVWRRINVDSNWLIQGKDLCPQDGTRLEVFRGESVPPTITVKRCRRCGKWWFPGDSLFDYKPAQEAKVNYFRMWGITTNVSGIALPVVGILILLVGLAVGLNEVRERQRVNSTANVAVSDFSAVYTGDNQLVVMFNANDVDTIGVRRSDGKEWRQLPVETVVGVRRVVVDGVTPGESYQIRIGGMEYGIIVK